MRYFSTLSLCLALLPPMAIAQGGPPTGATSKPASASQPTAQGGTPAKPANPFVSYPAAPGDGGNEKPAWQQFKLSKTKTVKLNFKNSNIDMVLQFMSSNSGITIVKDPALKDPITLQSAGTVTLSKAFEILNTILGLKGYALYKENDLLVVKQKSQQPAFDPRAFFGGDNGGNGGNGGRAKLELKVYPIQFANASEVARVVNDVFSPTGAPSNQNQNPFFGGGRFNRFQAQQVQPAAGAQPNQGPIVKASSDDFSNSVIVNASNSDQDQVALIIKQIDRQTEQPIQPKVFKLTYANATDVAPIVQNVLVSNAPKGRGGQGQQSVPFGQQFGAAVRFGAAAAFGNVVPDTRTNSLVVSATLENLALVDKVIHDLDKPTPIQDTTYVFQLANAKADQIATLLQQAFGNRQGVSGAGFNPNNQSRTSTAQTPNVTRNSVGATGGGAGGARPGATNLQDPNAQALAVAMQDPNATSGELLTSIGVQQGGFGGGGRGGFGGFGGQGGGQQGSGATSRDANGQIINTRDLSGQVTVIPDINTNSVIVVAPPEALNILKQILNQLDQIPQQVMIETVIVEADLNKSQQFGLEWKFAQQRVFGDPAKSGTGGQNFGLQSTTPALQGFSYTLTGGDLSAFFNALKTDVKFDVLSTPKIFTTNNVQAQINISQSIPYVVSSIQDAATGAISFNYAFENVGIILTVTPRITSNGYVQLDLDQTANDLQGYTSFNAPIVNQREANTSVSVKDGNTVILGGIIRTTISSTVNKVPLLGDIPLLGNLFRSTNSSKDKTELLIFLTPHVVKNADDAERLKNKTIEEASGRTQTTINNLLNTGTVSGNGKKSDPPTINPDNKKSG